MDNRSRGEKIFNVFNIILLTLLAIVCLYPFWYVFVASLSDYGQFKLTTFMWRPVGFTWAAYARVLNEEMIWTGFLNTIIMMLLRVGGAMLFTICSAYVVSRRKAMLVPVFMMMIIIPMNFNPGIIPVFQNVVSLGINNTMWALVLPQMINAFNTIILRNAFEAVPVDLEEAASIDGATQIKILFMVMLPLVIPTLMVVLLYYAVEVWNMWFDAMLYIKDKGLYPLQLVLKQILIEADEAATGGSDATVMSETVQYAVMVVATIPILLVYPFLQKYFVKGMTVGAVKG